MALVALYPAIDTQQRRELGTWWAPQILLFTQREMKKFLRSVKTVGGAPDKMFGFGFDDPNEAILTRGDRRRRYENFAHHLLRRRLLDVRRFLSP